MSQEEMKFNPELLGFKLSPLEKFEPNSLDTEIESVPDNIPKLNAYYLEDEKFKGDIRIDTFDYHTFIFWYNSNLSSTYPFKSDRASIRIYFEARNHEIGEAIVKSLFSTIDNLNLHIERCILKVENNLVNRK